MVESINELGEIHKKYSSMETLAKFWAVSAQKFQIPKDLGDIVNKAVIGFIENAISCFNLTNYDRFKKGISIFCLPVC